MKRENRETGRNIHSLYVELWIDFYSFSIFCFEHKNKRALIMFGLNIIKEKKPGENVPI